ncbi:hypothetical protein HOY80DRAFT_89488 [Tuber brumale]|nr:hypothetical protein HOY80DRAFT_89488 [Tuber brumale]
MTPPAIGLPGKANNCTQVTLFHNRTPRFSLSSFPHFVIPTPFPSFFRTDIVFLFFFFFSLSDTARRTPPPTRNWSIPLLPYGWAGFGSGGLCDRVVLVGEVHLELPTSHHLTVDRAVGRGSRTVRLFFLEGDQVSYSVDSGYRALPRWPPGALLSWVGPG